MNIKQLTYFAHVAKLQNYSKAAEELFVSQPTLCSSVHKLEEELGITLFNAKGRNIELTAEGRKLLEYTNSMLRQFNRFSQHANALSHPNAGNLNIGMPHSVGRHILARPIIEFCRMYPEIHLSISAMGAHRVQKQILDGTLECGFSMQPFEKGLSGFPIIQDELALIVPLDHPLNNSSDIHLEDIAGEKLILLGKEHRVYQQIVLTCSNLGIQPNVVLTCSEMGFIMDLVRANVGITIQSRMMAITANTHGLAVLPLDNGTHPWSISLVYKEEELSPIGDLFCEYFKSYYDDSFL